ncbi:unnamed protein product [Adineta ricciae]|uniref:Uncharacterized protein n=1 Tax=Adineta ricciae TaxID=249248 RepID=A0A816CJF2_ADIRI|nr:unnamed protein product [Adineta ricciae]
MNNTQTLLCNRGILVLFGQNQTTTCLCPPSYFGSQCQWQSQRISLTLQFISPSTIFISAIFQVIVVLINQHNEIIGNHERILFAPIQHCGTKFHLYLLYPHRPKSPSTNYSIRIDLFDKVTLEHWTSWHLPIPFQFLPVNRIAAQLFIPKQPLTNKYCPLPCGTHGRCVQYANTESSYFCQCHRHYSGPFCNISQTCHCSNSSVCVSSKICVCPLHRFGRRCYLERSLCSSTNSPCQNGGLCIPVDDRIDLHGYSCHCKEQYFGRNCELLSSRINLHLHEVIAQTSSFVSAHFITMHEQTEHERRTVSKRIPVDTNTVVFYTNREFHLVFLQLQNQTYYLAIVREQFIPLENIDNHITSKQLCPHVRPFLNITFLEYNFDDDRKYYPFVCRQHRHLMCFQDDTSLCVCDLDRFANCFTFNHTVDNSCRGHNDCENHGQCFQNNYTCPTVSICVCQDCFCGGKCQISTQGNLLSLDPIISYYIKPNLSFSSQPLVIKVTTVITLTVFLLGLIDVILSILTFHMKNPRVVGCGYYLLTSSIISLLLIITLVVKFLHLILSQMATIENRDYLWFSCKSIDMILKSLLVSNEWIIACVAIERTVSTMTGPKFDKKRSRQLARWVIAAVIVLTLLSHVHDPYYRRLITDVDENDQRIWCFADYPPIVHTYNYLVNLVHFLGPLIINIISAIMIIILVTRSRSHAQRNKSFDEHLKEQLYRHKHLLISPLMLVLLGTPRLILLFVSGCMRTPRDPWMYVLGYFVSFVPPILTFSTFVLPSANYRKEFKSAIRKQLIRFRSTFLSGH